MASLTITGLEKSFGKHKALSGIDLTVQDGELCVIVGPARSGKTTLLRAIAGLERVNAGTIAIDGEVVNDLKPRDRNVAMVFDHPALFPYLSVYENIAFGLRTRKVPRAEVAQRVERIAELLGIGDLLRRAPRHLTDGERQSVAIAHAVVRDAMLYLFDEPLARFDSARRGEMRAALQRLHQERQQTVVYVTHDQMEAMSIADRIVLLRDGKIEQEGAPIDLFERPASRFVAGFFGVLKMNFLPAVVAKEEERDAVRLTNGDVTVPLPPGSLPQGIAEGTPVILGLRPEHMQRAVRISPSDGTMRYEAEIELLQPTGSRVCATFRLGGEPAVAELQAHDVSAIGDKVAIDINLKRAMIFDAETEKALTPANKAAGQDARDS
jgi:multiple sugar transport system ATP-binding protein